MDWLVKDSEGYWVTAPSTSPENWFKDKNGKYQSVSVVSTMDMSIIWDFFTSIIEASELLNTDIEFRNQLILMREKLYPMKIGNKGQLLEWYKDFVEADPQHRHVSHLFGLFPGKQISADRDPEFFNAAKCTLEIRGGFVVDMEWSAGKLVKLKVRSKVGAKLCLRYKGKIIEMESLRQYNNVRNI